MNRAQNQIYKYESDWNAIQEKQVTSEKGLGVYKVNKSKYLGRGAFGIVYRGLRKLDEKEYEEVAIKQFKSSQNWNSQSDYDKELMFFKRYGSKWNQEYLVRVIEILRTSKNGPFWLIFELFKGGTLLDQLSTIRQDKGSKINQFGSKLAKILYYLHYQMFKEYQCSKEDLKADEKNAKIGLIHRDVKPSNILFVNQKITKDSKLEFKLADYGISIINYTDLQKTKNVAGTNIYKAPQLVDNNEYCAKVDVWGYGATMFQLLSGGERLFTGGAVQMERKKKIPYVKQRLIWLEKKLTQEGQKNKKNNKETKIKMIDFWIQLLVNCLKYDSKERWNSLQLKDYFKNSQNNIQKNSSNCLRVSQQQKDLSINKMLFEINFEIMKINYLQSRIFSILQYFSSSVIRINRITLYILLKFVSNYIMDRGSKVKEKAKIINPQKYQYYKSLIDEKLFSELRYSCTDKIKDELRGTSHDQYLNLYVRSKDPELIASIPEVITEEIRDSRRLIYEFIYLRRNQILANDNFAILVSGLASALDDFDEYSQMKVSNQDFAKYGVQFLSIQKHYSFFKSIKYKQELDYCKGHFNSLNMNKQVRSNLQKKRHQFDLPLQYKRK